MNSMDSNYPYPSIISPEAAKDTDTRLNVIKLQQLKKIIAHEGSSWLYAVKSATVAK